MKQHIDGKQYGELAKEQKKKIQDYFNKGIGDDWQWATHYSQITIGWMIEFLEENAKAEWKQVFVLVKPEPKATHFRGMYGDADNLCDALWEAVKEVLERKEHNG